MSRPAIRVENLGKRYRIGVEEEKHETLLGSIGSWFTAPVSNYRRLRDLSHFDDDEDRDDVLWALRDVSFEIHPGEVVGFIGRNGAGKSTLLKLLSRITYPTTGSIELIGRVSALLEVGTGFHQELTGRENVFLNGTILGMTKAEVGRKFDEIVEFSGVGKFIDTPVKRYSSGMKVRLGFAVAAHLEPDILVVDEVLAVGDIAFKKKCLGKMDEVSKSGRTVLYVSHEMSTVTNLCQRAYVLDGGRLVHQGPVQEAVEWYLDDMEVTDRDNLRLDEIDDDERGGDGRLRFTSAYLVDQRGRRTHAPTAGEPVDIVLEYEAEEDLPGVMFWVQIHNHLKVPVSVMHTRSHDTYYEIKKGTGRVRCRLPNLPLPNGAYQIKINAKDYVQKRMLDALKPALDFEVGMSTFYRSGFTPDAKHSTVLLEHAWTHEADAGAPLIQQP
ncbi:MAG: ABC transporter ATP-binding protein [Bacteroidota bacterium]